jgi:thiamine biosynthesis lipoprotein
MGSECHVVVVGRPALLESAESEVRRLESIWTRFDDASELSRLNSRAGEEVEVSDELLILARRAKQLHETTGGWFDPFLGSDIVSAGYDRDFETLDGGISPTAADEEDDVRWGRAPEPRRRRTQPMTLDVERSSVRLAPDVCFDPGGIGKGLAADLVSHRLMHEGSAGVLVNLGGDLRCRGVSEPGIDPALQPDEAMWTITVDDAVDSNAPAAASLRLFDGGVCTSSASRRRWQSDDGRTVHHLLDPKTGRPAPLGPRSVTIVAPEAHIADALSKAVYLGGPEIAVRLLQQHNAGAVIVDHDGSVHRI